MLHTSCKIGNGETRGYAHLKNASPNGQLHAYTHANLPGVPMHVLSKSICDRYYYACKIKYKLYEIPEQRGRPYMARIRYCPVGVEYYERLADLMSTGDGIARVL